MNIKNIIFVSLLNITCYGYSAQITKSSIEFQETNLPQVLQDLILDYAGYQPIFKIKTNFFESIEAATFISDNIIATVGFDNKIKIWDLTTRTVSQELTDSSFIEKLTCSTTDIIKTEDNKLVTVDTYGTTRVWSLANYKLINKRKNKAKTACIGIEPLKNTGFICCYPEEILVLNLNNAKRPIIYNDEEIIALSNILNSSCAIAINGGSNSIYFIENMLLSSQLEINTNQVINHLLILPDKKLATVTEDKIINIWDIETETCLKTFSEHKSEITKLVLLGNLIISGSTDKTVKFWAINKNKSIETLHLNKPVKNLTVSNTGKLAVINNDGFAIFEKKHE